jgi:hypothetical protein
MDPTTITGACPRAQGLARELEAIVKERRGQDPGLGIPDALVALDLVKASLLEESGIAPAGTRAILVAAVALAITVAGFMLFVASR